jgi:hypothetical protein
MSDEQLGLFDVPEQGDPGSVALAELLNSYDVVSAGVGDPELGTSSYVVVAERDLLSQRIDGPSTGVQLAETVAIGPELASSSPSPWTSWTREEHNPKLRDQMGITEYYRMKRIDGIVRGAMRVFKTPVLSAKWRVEPGGKSARDKNAAEFIADNLFDGLNVSWNTLLEDILLMCDYGHMIFEKVYELDSDGKIRLRKLGPRHPADVLEWVYDRNGGPDGVRMQSNDIQGEPNGVFIPIDKLTIFSLEAEAGDLRGLSVLRSAYMHYFYKQTLYKIDAIQKERHGIGIPVIKLPPGWSSADKRVAENLGRNLRTNERAHVTLPPNWELIFAKLEGQPVDCIRSIEHHNNMIMANVLAPFMLESRQTKEGLQTFLKATKYVADTVADTFNHHCIKDLVDYNWTRVKYPKLRARRIGEEEDQRTMSFTLRNYVGAGLITPDENTEAFLREEMDMPEADKETRRMTKALAPQQQTAGPPRQAAPDAARTNQGTAGQDRRGGGGPA